MTKGKLYGSQDSDHAIVHLGLNVSSSAHNCGCVVDGGNAMAAIEYYYYFSDLETHQNLTHPLILQTNIILVT